MCCSQHLQLINIQGAYVHIFIWWQMKKHNHNVMASQFEPMVWTLDIIRNFSFWVKSVCSYGFTNIAWSTKTNNHVATIR